MVESKSIPVHALRFQEVVALTLPPTGYIPGTHVYYSLSRPQDHSAAGGIKSANLMVEEPPNITCSEFLKYVISIS
jgi:hypothetical protein